LLSLSTLKSVRGLPQFSALRHRDYRLTWYSSMLSGAAMFSFVVAVSWKVLVSSDSSAWVGIITFSAMLPFLLVSPIGGLLGDTLDRRFLVLIMTAISAVIVGAMAIISASGHLELWLVAVLAFSLGTARAIQEPAFAALIPNQVPKDDLLNAIVLTGATRHGARFFGLLIAGPLLAVDAIGVNGVLVLSAFFHLMAAVQMHRVGTRSRGEANPERGMVGKILEGLVYIYTNQTLAVFILLVAFHCALVMSFESILPILSRQSLGADDGSAIAYLYVGFGAGAMVGMFALAGIRDDRRKGQVLLWTGLASGVAPLLLAFSTNLATATLASAAMGATQATFMAITNTYVQLIVPDRLRSRITSLYILHAGGIMAFANLGYGFIADAFSAAPILIITGTLFLVVMVGLGGGQPSLRHVYRTGLVPAV